MRLAFRVGDQTVNRRHVFLHLRRQLKAFHDLQHLLKASMRMVMRMVPMMIVSVGEMGVCMLMFMLMNMFVRVFMNVFVRMLVGALLNAVDLHEKARRGNPAARRPLARERNTLDSEGVKPRHCFVGVRHQFQKRGGKHVACGAHATVDVESLHLPSPMWLMRCARNPAPKPLSMFTTETPAAHELSIASSADTPPNAAP